MHVRSGCLPTIPISIEGGALTEEQTAALFGYRTLPKQDDYYELKSGIFEDCANGYAIGEYKKRPNMFGAYLRMVEGTKDEK